MGDVQQRGIWMELREEFQLKKFGFSGVKAERICSFQWRLPIIVYLIYRLVLMGYVLSWYIYIIINQGSPPQAWGAYLTIWTYTMLNIYLISHFLVTLIQHFQTLALRRTCDEVCCARPSVQEHAGIFVEVGVNIGGYEAISGSEIPAQVEVVTLSSHPPWYVCWVWMTFNVVSAAALMVTIVFFAFLFPDMDEYPHIGTENLQVHLLNSVIVMVEHLFTAIPIRLLHVIYPILYGLIYMIFSVVYWAEDHSRVMYPGILDWNHAGTTVAYVLLIGFVFIPALHSFFFLIYKLKMFIYRRL